MFLLYWRVFSNIHPVVLGDDAGISSENCVHVDSFLYDEDDEEHDDKSMLHRDTNEPDEPQTKCHCNHVDTLQTHVDKLEDILKKTVAPLLPKVQEAEETIEMMKTAMEGFEQDQQDLQSDVQSISKKMSNIPDIFDSSFDLKTTMTSINDQIDSLQNFKFDRYRESGFLEPPIFNRFL